MKAILSLGPKSEFELLDFKSFILIVEEIWSTETSLTVNHSTRHNILQYWIFINIILDCLIQIRFKLELSYIHIKEDISTHASSKEVKYNLEQATKDQRDVIEKNGSFNHTDHSFTIWRVNVL